MRLGQWITIPLRVPPKFEATCFVHVNGVSPATAHPAAMWGYVSGPPEVVVVFQNVLRRSRGTPLK